MRMNKIALGAAAIAVLASTAACGGNSNGTSAKKAGGSTSSSMASSSPTASGGSAAADLVGPGCAAYAKQVPSGAGSVQGMAQAPVATAASNNPLLKTLVAAVAGKVNPKVDLVDTLNGGQFTVFAPVDAAFQKVPAATMNTLKTNSKLLTKILTYHVVPGQIAPNSIDGSHKTVEGAPVKVTGSGDDLTVNGTAHVICGGVQTANATVYLIDSVLQPPK